MIYYIDGQYLSEDQAALPVQDLAILRGYGVFDFTRTYGGRPFHLEDHVRRLAASARRIELPLPHSPEEIIAITRETLARNPAGEANIRWVVTGGQSTDGLIPDNTARLLIMVTPVTVCPAQWYRDGAKIALSAAQRFLPDAKTINYIPAIISMIRARREEAIEAVYTDERGRLLEGTTSNIFAFINNRLVTPNADILPGITRQVVLALAREEFDVALRDLNQSEVAQMAEAFITSSNKEVVPVTRIDRHTVGSGKPGERTRRIMALFADYTRAYGEGG